MLCRWGAAGGRQAAITAQGCPGSRSCHRSGLVASDAALVCSQPSLTRCMFHHDQCKFTACTNSLPAVFRTKRGGPEQHFVSAPLSSGITQFTRAPLVNLPAGAPPAPRLPRHLLARAGPAQGAAAHPTASYPTMTIRYGRLHTGSCHYVHWPFQVCLRAHSVPLGLAAHLAGTAGACTRGAPTHEPTLLPAPSPARTPAGPASFFLPRNQPAGGVCTCGWHRGGGSSCCTWATCPSAVAFVLWLRPIHEYRRRRAERPLPAAQHRCRWAVACCSLRTPHPPLARVRSPTSCHRTCCVSAKEYSTLLRFVHTRLFDTVCNTFVVGTRPRPTSFRQLCFGHTGGVTVSYCTSSLYTVDQAGRRLKAKAGESE